MSDLISRQAAIKAFYIQSDDDGWWVGTAQDAETLLNGLPTAERVGKWVKMTGMMPAGYFGHYECSECLWHLSHHDKTKENELRFCPNCGARMMEEEDENDERENY